MGTTTKLTATITIVLKMYDSLVKIKKRNGETTTKSFKTLTELVNWLKGPKIVQYNSQGRVEVINQVPLGFYSQLYTDTINSVLKGNIV